MKRPTQADVARLAGVSRATVSYVINGRHNNISISDETRQKVMDAVDELGYQPDARAQSLRSGTTRTIGVLLPIYENPHFWQLTSGISEAAEKAGYNILLTATPQTRTKERLVLRELSEQRVDGLILLLGYNLLAEDILYQLRKSGRPVVQGSATESEFDHVRSHYKDGTKMLLNHLFDLGHRRFGFVYGVADFFQGYDRLTSFRETLIEADITIDDSAIVECGQGLNDGYLAAKKILSRPDRPTAILVINDLLAIATIRAANDLGLRVPEDVSVGSFDNIPFAEYTVPRLTTVHNNPVDKGRKAVEMILNRLKNPDLPRQIFNLPCELIIRESTGKAPVE